MITVDISMGMSLVVLSHVRVIVEEMEHQDKLDLQDFQ